MEYTQQQVNAFKQVTHIGKNTGIMFRVRDDSTLADFLWQDLSYWQRSSVTRQIIETDDRYVEFVWNENND